MKKLFYSSALFALALGLPACSGSVVSDSSSKSATPSGSPVVAQPAGNQAAATNPAAQQTPPPNQSATPSPTILPAIKEAQANPGVPVTVPDSLKRPFTPEEMQKVLQALPPEVRARMQGMQAAPAGVKPQATPTPKK